MSDVQAEADHLQVIFHDDDDTPMEFVVEVLHSVFKKPIADAADGPGLVVPPVAF